MEAILGLLILAFDIYAIVQIVGSGASTGAKIGWSLLVILLPVVGLLIWAFAGPRGRATATA
ncbi:MAG: PLDc_N domain-containing protein [Woeseia sp.]|nr:PLD nuclease N-terminal domain-containing protein [Woeseia sp.]NNE60444.1 PLDc_N domain-containing protein [Woeseia sp.]NNL54241.1 PLDc_N domain-containing protein [Woeseia sp.]